MQSSHFRPNFFAMCSPNWEDINCGTKSDSNFITNYECQGGNPDKLFELSQAMHKSPEELSFVFKRHAHTSFFSGHSSVAWSSAMFIYLYLKGSFQGKKHGSLAFSLVKWIQLISIGLATWVSYTRITDFWHHPTDVLVGSLVGMLCQYVNVKYLMQL